MRGPRPVDGSAGQVPVKTLAKALVERAGRLGLVWHLRPATVVAPDRLGGPRVVIDGDTVPVPATSVVGPLPLAARVMVLISPPSGHHVVGYVGSPRHPLGVIAHIDRVTTSTPNTGAQAVLRLDDVPVLAGRRYTIRAGSMILLSTVANDNAAARLTTTDDGTSAGTGSTLRAQWNSSDIATTGGGTGGYLSVDYRPVSSHLLSVLLYTTRIQGTGAISAFAAVNQPLELVVEDKGMELPTGGEGFVL